MSSQPQARYSALARAMGNEHLYIACQALVLCLILFQSVTLDVFAGRGVLEGTPDFAAFYTAGKLALEGRAIDAYDSALFFPHIKRVTGMDLTAPWAYPPPAFLFCAPFAALPFGLSFLAFTGGSFLLFCALLRRLAGNLAAGALAFSLPALVICALAGQNGFWSGALLCWLALVLRRAGAAGLPLGLFVMKPHLGLGVGLLALLRRRWSELALTAGVGGGLVVLSTALFGLAAWPALMKGLATSGDFMSTGKFPLARMTSAYAMFYRFGALPSAALALHAVTAAIGAGALALLCRRRVAAQLQLAAAMGLGLLLSPYLYDYDLVALGVVMALVLPHLLDALGQRGGPAGAWLGPMLVLAWLASANSPLMLLKLYVTLVHGAGARPTPIVPLSFPSLVALGLLIALALRRRKQEVAGEPVPI